VLRQHSCVYVKRSGQFQANQAQEQLDELAKNCTPVCHIFCANFLVLHKLMINSAVICFQKLIRILWLKLH